MIKENRSNELRLKDKITRLRRELEEAKERKKISITEKDQLRKGKYFFVFFTGGSRQVYSMADRQVLLPCGWLCVVCCFNW